MKKFILFILIIISTNILIAQTRVFPFKKDSQWGVIDENLKVIKEPSFDMINFFVNHNSSDAYSYVKLNSKVGLINRKGNITIPIEYDNIVVWENIIGRTARIIKEKKVGIFDLEKMKVGIPPIYHGILPNRSGEYYLIGTKTERGICDINHKIIVPIKYKSVSFSKQEDGSICFKAELKNVITIYDKNGTIVKQSKPQEDWIEEEEPMFMDAFFGDDENFITPIKLDTKKLGTNTELLNTIFNKKNSQRFGIVRKDGLKGIIDKKSNLLVPIEYLQIKEEHHLPGLLLTKENNLYGWFSMDKKKIMLPARFSKIELASKLSPKYNSDKQVDNYFFITDSKQNLSGIFDIATGQIFLPKK